MERLYLHLKWSALAVALLCALLAVACSPAAQAPAPAPGPAGKDEPQYGGTARLFGLSSPAHLDILATAVSSQSRAVGGIYEALVNYDYADPDYYYSLSKKIVPGLAERWEIAPDAKTYTFFLRKDVKFHDGEPFTSADVLYTYNRIITEKTPSLSTLRDVISVDAPDPYTVKITTKVADVAFLGGLTSNNLGIYSKHAADKGTDFTKVAIGTGPFKLGRNDVKTLTEWVKNDNYYQKGLPYLDRVEVIWPLDAAGLLAAFVSGNIDTTGLSNQSTFDTIKKSVPNVQFAKGPFGTTTDLYLNIKHPALKDVRVRQAMQLAIDRQDLSKLVSGGDLWLNCVFPAAAKVCYPGFEQRPGYRQPKDQDISEAKRLLTEAGYPNGFAIKALFSTAYTQSVPLVEPFVGYMARIGVKVTPDGRDTASFSDAIAQGSYDGVFNTMLGLEPGPSLQRYYHTKGVSNKNGVGTPRLDELIDQQGSTFNAEERTKMFQEMQKIVLDNAFVITFVDATQYLMAQPWLKGSMILHGVSNGQFAPAPVMGNAWMDQRLAPKR